jgi:hypothetical protein
MRTRAIAFTGVVVFVAWVAACASDVDLLGPITGPAAHNQVVVYLDGSGDSITYKVQAITIKNGDVYNIPSCLTAGIDTLSHTLYTRGFPPHDTAFKHRDRRITYSHNGTCGAPSPFNGGWVNVYEVDADGDHFVGVVYGDMVWKNFTYTGPSYKSIKLHAFPDQVQTCSVMGTN